MHGVRSPVWPVCLLPVSIALPPRQVPRTAGSQCVPRSLSASVRSSLWPLGGQGALRWNPELAGAPPSLSLSLPICKMGWPGLAR